MKVIIVGLGRMGMQLALKLQKSRNDVTAIDIDCTTFEKLGSAFSGKTIAGVGFDKDILEQAGINRVDAVVACTSSDEANVVIARIAKNTYRVPKVIARSYDSRKAEIYRRLGIETFCTTSWGVEKASEMLSLNNLGSVYEMGDGSVSLIRIDIPMVLIGQTVRDITKPHQIKVSSVVRDNAAFIPTHGTILEKNDVIYFSVINTALPQLKKLIGLE